MTGPTSEDEDMVKSEETEPETVESEDNTQVADAGVPGQIQYPDREVDAERAAAFAGGKVDTLYAEDDPRNEGWTNPADRSAEVTDENAEEDSE